MPNKRVDIPPVILILIAIVVGVLALFAYMYPIGVNNSGSDPVEVQDPQVRQLESVSASDDVETIQAELDETNVENLDNGMDEAARDSGY